MPYVGTETEPCSLSKPVGAERARRSSAHSAWPAPPVDLLGGSSASRDIYYNRPYLPTDVQSLTPRPACISRSWKGFPVEAVHLGQLDERQFTHFASEREIPLTRGLLDIKTGELIGDTREPRGEIALSGKGFAGPAAIKMVFHPDSLAAVFWGKAPGAHRRGCERYHLVLHARWAPRLFAYMAGNDGCNVVGQIRVTALDAKHAEQIPFLSRFFLIVLRLPYEPLSRGPSTAWSLSDLLSAFQHAGYAPCELAGLSTPLIHSRSYDHKCLERLDTSLRPLSPTLAFHLEGIVRDGTLTPSEICRLIAEHVKPWEVTADIGDALTEDILVELRTLLEEDRAARAQLVLLGQFFRADVDTAPLLVEEWAEKARVRVVEERKRIALLPRSRRFATSEHFRCRSVSVTPSGVIRVGGRVLERSNAVIRRYYDSVDGHKESDHFLRVLFRDEDGSPFAPMCASPEHDQLVQASVGRVLKYGLAFSGRQYEFLAYSQSSLRERAVWFVSPWIMDKRYGQALANADSIRHCLGNFSKVERMPAKLGSRLSQGFTASHASVVLHFDQISACDDISEVDDNGHELSCHTDGAGLMSLELRDQVWATLLGSGFRRDRDAPPPSVFQVRLGGSKGILVVDNSLKGSQLMIRPSQDKFLGSAEADDHERFCLNVADAFTRPMPLRLNRPLISALEDLGIDKHVFLRHQRIAIDEVEPQELGTLRGALHALTRFLFGRATRFHSLLTSLVELNNIPDSLLHDEPFLHGALEVIRVRTLRDLREKASIPIPKAYVLVGVPDHDRVLRENQVFAALRFPGTDKVVYLEGRIVVTRSPTLDPGDIRVLHAIGKPPEGAPLRLHSLENCLVFPTVGERAIASTMGGGDLDGDIYQVICSPEFLPNATADPLPYRGEPPVELDRAATIDDVAECLLRFIQSDSTGVIATNHLVVADKSPQHGFDPVCKQLAHLHSLSVDAAKTGKVVSVDRLPDMPDRRHRPDFLRKTLFDRSTKTRADKISLTYYESQRALGHLYRAIGENCLTTPSVVEEQRVLKDSLSQPFRFLRRSVELDLAVLLGIPLEQLKRVPAAYRDTVTPTLEAFAAVCADLSRRHALPLDCSRQLSELELFAVTSLLESHRHEAARGSAVASTARELGVLVNWLENELTGSPPKPGALVNSETLRLRYSAWVLAVDVCDPWNVGIKTARWTCLALLLEAMRDKVRSPTVASPQSASTLGSIRRPSQLLARCAKPPTPPPSPPLEDHLASPCGAPELFSAPRPEPPSTEARDAAVTRPPSQSMEDQDTSAPWVPFESTQRRSSSAVAATETSTPTTPLEPSAAVKPATLRSTEQTTLHQGGTSRGGDRSDRETTGPGSLRSMASTTIGQNPTLSQASPNIDSPESTRQTSEREYTEGPPPVRVSAGPSVDRPRLPGPPVSRVPQLPSGRGGRDVSSSTAAEHARFR